MSSDGLVPAAGAQSAAKDADTHVMFAIAGQLVVAALLVPAALLVVLLLGH